MFKENKLKAWRVSIYIPMLGEGEGEGKQSLWKRGKVSSQSQARTSTFLSFHLVHSFEYLSLRACASWCLIPDFKVKHPLLRNH